MTRTMKDVTLLPDTGYNLTDAADFTAMATGAGNGVEIVYDPATRVVLKNTTGGAAVFTVKIPTPSPYSAIGITLSDVTVSVTAGKTWLLRPHAVMKQADGKIYIDCDVAASILVLK